MSTTTTHITTENNQAPTEQSRRVPALRFMGFDTNLKNVGFTDVGKIMIGLTHTPTYISEGKPFLSSKNISDGFIDFENVQHISEEKFASMPESTKPKKGDILFTRVGSNLGNPIVLNVDIEFGVFVSLGFFRVNDKAHNLYIQKWMASNYFWRQLEQKVAGGAKNNLNTGWLKEFRLNLPSLPEQQKIASFLSAVDKKIQQLTKKKELLKDYKKGVMQQLFSGKLRFKDADGNEFPDWEERRLGEVGNIVSGLTYSPDDIDENGVLVLRSSNVHGRQVTFDDNVHVNVVDGKFNSVEENDIIICVRNGSKRLIGKNALIKGEAIGVAFGAFMTVYRSTYNLFLFHYFDTVDYKKEVHKNLGATINSINGSDLKKFKIPFPCLKEQQKIATYLSRIDTKIESVNTQITQTQTFKKGLLQQMFV